MKTHTFAVLAVFSAMLSAMLFTCAKKSPTGPEEKDFTGQVTGYVYGKLTNRPLSGVIVSINADSATPCVTDVNGKFTVGKVSAGRHRLHFTHPDWEIDSSMEFSIARGEDLTLSDTARLSYAWYLIKGRVTKSGAPVSGAGVALAGYSEGTLTSAGGSFVLRKVPKLDTVELISALGGTGVGFRRVTGCKADDTTNAGDLELASTGAVVSGIVYYADSKPAANMTVTAVAAGIQARTDAQGMYRLGNVPANRAGVLLTVSGGGYIGTITGVYAEEGAYLAGCDIHLSAGDRQEGVVRLNSADVYAARGTPQTVLIVTPEMAGVSAILQEYEWDIGGTVKTTSVPRCTVHTASMSGSLSITVTARGTSYSGTNAAPITVRTSFLLKFRADKPVIDSVKAITQSGVSGRSVTVYEGEWIVLHAWVAEFFGGIKAMTWNFGDGATWTSPDSNPVVGRLYTQAGTYTAVFQVKDVDGYTVKDSLSITVKRPEFSAPTLLRPFDRDTVRTTADSVRLVWNRVPSTGITYTVYLDDRTDRPVTAVAESVNDTFVTIKADSGKTYFW